jgi:hypothetical protein
MRALEVTGRNFTPLKLYIDDQNLIARQAFTTTGPDGMPVMVEEVFSGYRMISGVNVPFEAQLLQNGQPIIKRTLKSVTFNGPVPESTFARPQ